MQKKAMIISIVFLFFSGTAAAAAPKFPELYICMGARAAGMGGAYTAAAGSADSIFWNAAGLSSIKAISIGLSYNMWAEDTGIQYITAAMPAGPGVLGLTGIYTNLGSVEERDGSGNLLDKTINSFSISGTLAYGVNFSDSLSAGAGVKVINKVLSNLTSNGILFDAGINYRPLSFLKAGVSLRNFDLSGGTGEFPFIAAGVMCNPVLGDFTLTGSFDTKISDIYGVYYNTGVEVLYSKFLAIRAGYEFKDENAMLNLPSGISAGFGLLLGDLSIDYAFTGYGVFGGTHLAGINFMYTDKTEKGGKSERMLEVLAGQYYSEAQDYFNNEEYDKAIKKWENLKAFVPDYKDVDSKIESAKQKFMKSQKTKELDAKFASAMAKYEAGKYPQALKSWEELKAINPYYPEIDIWLDSARKMVEGGAGQKLAESCFNEGLKYFNSCMYEKSIDSWDKCDSNEELAKRSEIYKAKAMDKMRKIKKGISEADSFLNAGSLLEGVRKLRDVVKMCSENSYASERLAGLKNIIKAECEKYYDNGLTSYVNNNPIQAISDWEKIESLDPNSKLVGKARDNIEKAKLKLRSVESLGGNE